MANLLLFVGLILALHAGFALMALSQDRHRRTLGVATPLSRRRALVLRIAGGTLIALGLLMALWRDGPGFGPLLWITLLSVAALAVTAIVTWRPRWLAVVARVLPD